MIKIRNVLCVFLSLLLTVLLLSNSVHAASLSIYNYEDLTDYVESGLTINVDGDNNQISLNGTNSQLIRYDFDDLYTANDKGSSLDPTKYYAAVYEYVSGSITTNGGKFYPIKTISNAGSYLVDEISVEEDRVDVDAAFLMHPNSATKNQLYIDSGVEFTNLVYKIHFIEISNVEQSDYDVISNLTSIVDSDVTVSFPSANQIVINGTDDGERTNIVSAINPQLLNSDDLYLLIVDYVSGDTNATGYNLQLLDIDGTTLFTNEAEQEVLNGYGFIEASSFSVGSNTTTRFTDYTYNLIAKKIVYDDAEDTGSGDTGSGDTGSGDTGSGDTGSGDTGSGDTGSGDTGSGDTGSGGVITPNAETPQLFGIAWYYWLAVGVIGLWYFGFTKEGRKVLGLQ